MGCPVWRSAHLPAEHALATPRAASGHPALAAARVVCPGHATAEATSVRVLSLERGSLVHPNNLNPNPNPVAAGTPSLLAWASRRAASRGSGRCCGARASRRRRAPASLWPAPASATMGAASPAPLSPWGVAWLPWRAPACAVLWDDSRGPRRSSSARATSVKRGQEAGGQLPPVPARRRFGSFPMRGRTDGVLGVAACVWRRPGAARFPFVRQPRAFLLPRGARLCRSSFGQ